MDAKRRADNTKRRAELLKAFKFIVPIDEALGWELDKTNLRHELTDQAEELALEIGAISNDEDDNEYAKIVVEGANFVVTSNGCEGNIRPS